MATKQELMIGEDEIDPDDGGQYFVDQATGQYYYQSKDGQTMTVVQTGDDADAGTTAGAGSTSAPEAGPSEAADTNKVVLNSGGDQYQTVTIVPSEGGSGGEVSYVLIVQQPDDEVKNIGGDGKRGEGEEGVYDFDDENFGNAMAEFDEKGQRINKGSGAKRSQQVMQTHMCNYCNYTTPKRYLLSRHMKSHSEERPHKCSVCERGFKTLASLQNHVNTHTGTKPHRCKFCEMAFTTSGELVRHVRYRHTLEKPHKCTECDYSSVELSKLKRHMRCHTGERPYQCPHCTYASPDTFKLKRHLRIHTGEKPYECDICHARFTQSNSLKAHRLIHTGEKPVFQCELCPTTCGRKTDLRLHVQKLHTSEKPLHCKMCGKSFADRYSLKVHKKTHEGEKCFKCDLCPYSSISQRHLESHMLIHTDQKPFQCDLCDQSFRQKQLLKRHQNLYHNPNYIPPLPKEKTHECPECGRSFRHKGNLIRHMALHDPESTAAEKALALKIGRQKRVQVIDGQQVEVFGEDDFEEEYEDEEDDLMDPTGNGGSAATGSAADGGDGQHYVVLEVIQLPDGEQQVQEAKKPNTDAPKANDASKVTMSEDSNLLEEGDEAMDTAESSAESQLMTSSLIEAKSEIASDLINVQEKARPPVPSASAEPKEGEGKQKAMANCFGFDDDDD